MRTLAGFIVAITLIAAGILATHHFIQTSNLPWPDRLADSWKDVAELAILFTAGVLALVQLWLLLQQIKDQQRQSAEEHRKEQARRTLELDEKLTSDGVAKRREIIQAVFPINSESNDPIPLATLRAALQKHDGLEAHLYAFLGVLDMLALPVCARVAHERMAFELFSTTLVWYGTAFREYIEDHAQRHEGWCCYLVLLAERWGVQKQKETGQERYYTPRKLGDIDAEDHLRVGGVIPWSTMLVVQVVTLVAAGFVGAACYHYLWR